MMSRGTDSRRLAAPIELAESEVRAHYEQLLGSPMFDASERSRSLLTFVLNETLDGRSEHLTQVAIAMAVFGRDANFDPVLDPIVRVQAGRVRRSLERYYLLARDPASLRIDLPKGCYTPVFLRDTEPRTAAPADLIEAQHWSNVVVVPFEAGSTSDADDAAQLYDELTMEMSRYGNARVIRQCDAAHLDRGGRSQLRYELGGNIRSIGTASLIRAHLIDRRSGVQLWSEEYHPSRDGCWSSKIEDVGRIVAASVCSDQGVLLRQLLTEHGLAECDAAGAAGAILRSQHFFLSGRVSELVVAIPALFQATAREPANATLWIQLARLCATNHAFQLSALFTPIEKTIGYASRAVALDPTGIRATCVLAASLLIKGELLAAREQLDEALGHNGESLVHRETVGWLLALTGDWDRGMALVRDAGKRNPNSLPHLKQALWADHLRRGEFEKSYVAALEFRDASGFWPQVMVLSSLGHLGRACEAGVYIDELLAARPDFVDRGQQLIGYLIKSPEFFAKIIDGLGKAGLLLA